MAKAPDWLEAAPCGYLVFADDGTLLQVNATLEGWLGYAPGELDGAHINRLLTGASRIFHQTHIFPLLKLQGHIDEVYLSLCDKQGETLPVLTNAVRRAEDDQWRNECVCMPMRQRRRYEDEILQAKKAAEAASEAKAKFLSMMSHDLRTPLQTISTTTFILMHGQHGPLTEDQKTDLKRIENASEELMRLITDILSFARLESGQVEINLDTVSLESAVERAEALTLVRMQAGGIDYHRDAAACRVAVRADADRLQQILLNLITNAIKFTATGGRIVLSCDCDERMARLHVSDSGVGIPSDHLERIFEPFIQVDRKQVSATRRGVGLGLAISRELARAMQGDVTVDSRVGQGSVFSIHLPRADV